MQGLETKGFLHGICVPVAEGGRTQINMQRWAVTGEKEKERLLLLLRRRCWNRELKGGAEGTWSCWGEQAKPRDGEALRWREAWSGRRGQSQHGGCISDVMLWAVAEWSGGG